MQTFLFIKFGFWVEDLGIRYYNNHESRNMIKNMRIRLCRVLKHMGGIIIRLKAIEYKEDSSYYLSFYSPDLGLEATYFLTLLFRPYTFKTFVSSAKHICSPKSFRIPDLFNNMKPQLLLQQSG